MRLFKFVQLLNVFFSLHAKTTKKTNTRESGCSEQTCLPLRIVRIFYGFRLKTTHYGLIKKILRKSVIYDESDFDYFGLFSVIFKKCLIINVVCTWLKVWCSRVIIKLGWKTSLICVRIFFTFCRHYCLVNFPFDPDINIYFRFTLFYFSYKMF